MNITSYNEKTRYLMPLGIAVLKEGYLLASADEFMYKYLDKNADKPFTDMIHPEDRKLFTDAVDKLEEGTQYILARFRTAENHYKYMLFKLSRNKKVLDGFRCIEVLVSDIISAMDKHVANRVNLMKYRRMMCLVDNFFFDYVKKTNHINIYMYANDKSYMFLSEDLDVWSEQMLANYLWKDSDKKKFEIFCSYLKDGLDEFKLQLSTTFFSKGNRPDSLIITGSILFDSEGNKLVTGTIKTNADIMEKPYYVTEASKDSATGLMNKRAIMEYAAQKIKENAEKPLELLVIDIDDFKNINDTYGHLFGDKVILRVAETFKRIVGIRGTVARFGGDEFVVLLEDCDKDTLNSLLKTIYGEISMLVVEGQTDLNITISAGVANFPNNGTTYEELFQKADMALYLAKANGKNIFVFYDEAQHEDVEVIYDGQRIKGLKSIASRVNRSVLYSEIILALSDKGEVAFPEVAGKICELYDLEGILIFVGDDMQFKKSFGHYSKQLQRFSLLDNQEFVELLGEDDVVAVEDIKRFEQKSFYKNYRSMEIIASLISVYREEGKAKAVITFDTFNTSRHWSDEDIISLGTIGKLIGQKVAQNQ